MFFLINKPLEFTSFDLIRKLRKITGIKKMGHTGTLDPLATGCILIATDDSTKLISKLENQEKRYIFTVDISIFTPSFDLDTKEVPIKCSLTNIVDHHVDDLKRFIELQTSQIPPKYSAIHIEGKRAYDLARKGKDFDMMSRPISVKDVKIIEKSLPRITIELTISSGGYIRSFGPLIGDFFGTKGGCITYLQRIQIGSLHIGDCQELSNFDIGKSIPYESIFSNLEIYQLDIKYKKNLIDGLIIDIGTSEDRIKNTEFLVYCDDIKSLCVWTPGGIKVKKNYV